VAEFRATHGGEKWANCNADAQLRTPSIRQLLINCQRPEEVFNTNNYDQTELDLERNHALIA